MERKRAARDRVLSNPPESIVQSGNKKGTKRAGKLLKAFPESNPISQVWRFDFAVKQIARAQPVSYTIGVWKIPSSCRRATPFL